MPPPSSLLVLSHDGVWLTPSGDDVPERVAPTVAVPSWLTAGLPYSVLLRDGEAWTWPEGGSGWEQLDREQAADLLRLAEGEGEAPSPGPARGRLPELARRARTAGPRGVVCAVGRRAARRLLPGDAQPEGHPPAAAPEPPSDRRTSVFGLHCGIDEARMSLALGLIFASARRVDDGRLNERYDLRPLDFDGEATLRGVEREREQGASIVYASSYVWSLARNLEVSARAKELDPRTIVVHGGPNVPKYEHDAVAFLDANPQVDVLVRGEGELTALDILRALPPDPDAADLDALADVPGLTYRRRRDGGENYVRTPDRARSEDVNEFPSPFLTGEFDHVEIDRAVVETNRGCPYGCTFCDWGAATMSKVRQFDLERVYGELEWLARRGVGTVIFADANFGMLPRDADIARHVADLKRRYGKPDNVFCAFAKNKTKYTREIVRAWVEAGMCTEGSLALQTTDTVVLENIQRANIRADKYDELAEEFRRLNLPIVTDLIMGLPGGTVESFKQDLQRCLDQDVTPRAFEALLLPNTPMNDPEYRERFQLRTADDGDYLVATSSYGPEDFWEMVRLRAMLRTVDHFGLLRHVLRYLRREHGLKELDVIQDLDRAVAEDPQGYPLLAFVARCFDVLMVPPVSWSAFYDEAARWIEQRYGVADEGLATVLEVQMALMPSPGRSYPLRVSLPHDYVAYHRERDAGRPLTDYPPASLEVDDRNRVSDTRFGQVSKPEHRHRNALSPFLNGLDWELASPLTRPLFSTADFAPTPEPVGAVPG